MFRSAKEIAYTGITVALLIGGQLSLSAISGVEIVTAIFAVYCVVFGAIRGVVVATAFSIVRCFAFGFSPQIIVLYLTYYNVFALCVGLVGFVLKDKKLILIVVLLTLTTAILTCCFTLLDNFINIYILKIPQSVWKIYVSASIPVAVRQVICTLVTVPLFFYPLYRVFLKAKQNL